MTRDLIHHRFGHLHEDGLLKLDTLGVRGALGFAKLPDMHLCPSCAIGKSRVADIDRKSTRDNDPSEEFHRVALDIWGPMSTPDLNENKWALGAAACYKNTSVRCSLMKSKSEATDSWKGFIVTIKSFNFIVERIRIANDSVFLCAKFMHVCQDENIVVERAVP
jgi:hypothetical protein